jgi:hypothetical protein
MIKMISKWPEQVQMFRIWNSIFSLTDAVGIDYGQRTPEVKRLLKYHTLNVFSGPSAL